MYVCQSLSVCPSRLSPHNPTEMRLYPQKSAENLLYPHNASENAFAHTTPLKTAFACTMPLKTTFTHTTPLKYVFSRTTPHKCAENCRILPLPTQDYWNPHKTAEIRLCPHNPAFTCTSLQNTSKGRSCGKRRIKARLYPVMGPIKDGWDFLGGLIYILWHFHIILGP